MTDAFITAAGPAPAPASDARWRQVALLAASSAIADNGRARSELAAVLLALDRPQEALSALRGAPDDEPWAAWWRVLGLGQSGRMEEMDAAIVAALASPGEGPDARDVARRLADLRDELHTLRAGEGEGRFTILGHRARPERRALIGGRSSSAFLIDPSWEGLTPVRLAPSEGPRAGNRAHLTHAEVLEAVRRGDPGASRDVPEDRAAELDPEHLLDELKEDRRVRDRGLLDLAEEVREERHQLRVERAALEEERDRLRTLLRAAPSSKGHNELVPTSAAEAARLLGVPAGAASSEVERAYRAAIVRCHPDRVADLHPAIHGRAEELTVALNAARDLLSGAAPRRRRTSPN